MQITTCQMAQTKKMQSQGWTVIDVTVKLGEKIFAPTWDMVNTWNVSSKDKAAENLYVHGDESNGRPGYRKMMLASWKSNKARWLEILGMERVCFSCFCPMGAFCHRVLLADYMKKVGVTQGIECEIIPEGETRQLSLPIESNKYYAGIGSREATAEALEEADFVAQRLANKGYTLRSGGAKGMDSSFEAGCNKASGQKEIFRPKNVPAWCYEEVKKHLRSGSKLEGMKDYVQALLARNMQQVLGRDGDRPVEFVVCWTPAGDDGGGTGYAIRCAKAHGIPVYNLKNLEDKVAFEKKYLS